MTNHGRFCEFGRLVSAGSVAQAAMLTDETEKAVRFCALFTFFGALFAGSKKRRKYSGRAGPVAPIPLSTFSYKVSR